MLHLSAWFHSSCMLLLWLRCKRRLDLAMSRIERIRPMSHFLLELAKESSLSLLVVSNQTYSHALWLHVRISCIVQGFDQFDPSPSFAKPFSCTICLDQSSIWSFRTSYSKLQHYSVPQERRLVLFGRQVSSPLLCGLERSYVNNYFNECARYLTTYRILTLYRVTII